MNLLQSKILTVFLLTTILASAQVPTSDELWDSLTMAANADIYTYRIGQRDKNRNSITDSITNQLTNLQKVFDEPYSYDAVNRTLESVEMLISNPNITPNQAQTAERLYYDSNNYETVAKTLYTGLTLESDNNAFTRVGKLLGMPEMAPIYVNWMSQDIQSFLKEHGFFEMIIDNNYSYLNKKIRYVKENLTSLAENSDGEAEQLISQLRSVLNTVNEISTDFPIVKILLDQEFKTEEE